MAVRLHQSCKGRPLRAIWGLLCKTVSPGAREARPASEVWSLPHGRGQLLILISRCDGRSLDSTVWYCRQFGSTTLKIIAIYIQVFPRPAVLVQPERQAPSHLGGERSCFMFGSCSGIDSTATLRGPRQPFVASSLFATHATWLGLHRALQPDLLTS